MQRAWLDTLFNSMGFSNPSKVLFNILNKINEELDEDKTGPYFFGSEFSLVDIDFIPMFERMEGTLTYFQGIRIRGSGQWPNINKWVEAMETRDTYLATRSDYYTNAHASPPQLGDIP